jgi:hypothetical protein
MQRENNLSKKNKLFSYYTKCHYSERGAVYPKISTNSSGATLYPTYIHKKYGILVWCPNSFILSVNKRYIVIILDIYSCIHKTLWKQLLRDKDITFTDISYYDKRWYYTLLKVGKIHLLTFKMHEYAEYVKKQLIGCDMETGIGHVAVIKNLDFDAKIVRYGHKYVRTDHEETVIVDPGACDFNSPRTINLSNKIYKSNIYY